ncbi:D-alanyl-D-alanine carboxypeptidase [Streptomyces sp. FBKL.4005]|uniref:D-alanyl-D-alanine carboxypeptidase n=1 Tax=Streptomyces sp. FBKL.4005 TaxID=2015515 RepID=UPI000B9680F5|nr:D-alanyl-D-alanine carboxypeptidase [Streptomyces sp. FBKL.4005]OYP20278.1 D-alanyl-D-alanine carboxypeptidase [Streptomyces sp. FBKL.4005]
MEEASVAGESPDRSKQRESSAEPTSGSAGSVPEARDPRLAVSREKDSSGDGPDTATKVLTVRPETPTTPKQPAGTDEDTALRAAVSTWVRDSNPDAPANSADEPASETPSETEEASGEKAEAKAKAKAEKSSGAEAEPEQASDAKADAEADADANAKSETDADAKGSTGAKGEADAESEADGEDGPEAADGGDAPQGPPADDDETRTGGAGGNTDAEGEAEAKAAAEAPQATRAGGNTDADGEAEAEAPADAPQAKAPADTAGVDQATTVFKAVRPKKPAVDQPTTMLKLGGKPNPPESDSERTSKFVALKDDLRKPPAPQPKPAAQPKATPQPKPAAQPAPDATTPVPQVGPERTTQQPLPPKPPLDLLAELTNTPPPPETPVRTLVRRIKIWTPLVLLLVIVFAVVQAFRPLPSPTLTLTGEDTYTFDGGRTNLPWPGEGQGWMDVDGVGTMGHFGKQTPVAIGSVAKTMTAYIILKEHPLKPGEEGPKIKVDATAEKEGGYNKAGESTLDTVKAGDHLTEKQALSAVMIPSANNIARLLARWDAGSEEAFVKKMNATARELGMTDTTYTDPSGLKETTVSTAEDQVKLGRAFVKVPALVAISSAASWTDPSGRFWPNYNELPFKIGAIGIKTGSTTAAGGNLLFASRKEVGGRTVTLVGAILGQHKREILATVNAVSKTALLAAQDALTSKKILKKGDVVGYVDDRLGGHTPIVVTKDVTAAGWAGLKVKLSFASGTVPHTAKAGTRVGTLTVGDGTPAAVKVPVALEKDLAEPGFGAKLTRLG